MKSAKTFVTMDWVQSSTNVGITHFSSAFTLCDIECRLSARESLASNSTTAPATQSTKSTFSSLSPQMFFRKRSTSSPVSFFGSSSPSKGLNPPSYVSVFLDFVVSTSNLALIKGYSVECRSAANETSPIFPVYGSSATPNSSSLKGAASSSGRGSPATTTSMLHDGRVFFTTTYISENCFKPKGCPITNSLSSTITIEGSIGFEVELTINEASRTIVVVMDGWIPEVHHRRHSHSQSQSISSSLSSSSSNRGTPVPIESSYDDASPDELCGERRAVELAVPIPRLPPARLLQQQQQQQQWNAATECSALASSPSSTADSAGSFSNNDACSPGALRAVMDDALSMMCDYLAISKPVSACTDGSGSTDLAVPAWTHRTSKKQIDVYSAKLSYSTWQIIKAQSTIAASKDSIFKLLINDDNMQLIDDMIDSVDPVLAVDDRTFVRRIKAKGVWPTDPRDFIVCTTWREFPDGAVAIISRSVSDELYPPKKGYVRGFVQVSGYVIQPEPSATVDCNTSCERNEGDAVAFSSASCKITLLAHTELGGSLPATVINLLSVSAPLKIVTNVERLSTAGND